MSVFFTIFADLCCVVDLVFVALEEILSEFTSYWKIIFGPLLVFVVLYARGGISGWIDGSNNDN